MLSNNPSPQGKRIFKSFGSKQLWRPYILNRTSMET
jgi:hypothetical protein